MHNDQTALFREHIRNHASRYYPDFVSEEISVELLLKQERPSAVLYRFKVSNNMQTRSLFVKVPTRTPVDGRTPGNALDKPLLFPKTEPQDMHWLQYTALQTIHQYFTGINKEQLGAIRVLDYLPHEHAILTEESTDPGLRQLFFKSNRLNPTFTQGQLAVVFGNVGIWLRVYHTMPKEDNVKVRHPHRDDYVNGISQLTDFLAKALGDHSFFSNTASTLAAQAREALPDVLPLGLGHGDYALRNILVGENGRVTSLDTLAKWRTPIYEDIGYFLTELKMSFPQVISQGLAFREDHLSAYECAFLAGYFEKDPIPYPAIRLYEALALLDKWSSTITKCHRSAAVVRGMGWLKVMLISPYFKRRVRKLLTEITGTQLSPRFPGRPF